MKAYETVFVLVPELEKEAIDNEIARVKAVIEKLVKLSRSMNGASASWLTKSTRSTKKATTC